MKKKFCPNCGTENVDNAKFCINCGTKFGVKEEEKSVSQESDFEKASDENAEAKQTIFANGKLPEEFVAKQKNKKKILIGSVVAIILILILGIASQPKIVNLSIQYEGDTNAGTVLDENNKGIIVKGIDENGKIKTISGWKVKEPATFEADEKAKVTIIYKNLQYGLAIQCSTSAVKEIYAEYTGSAEAGTVLDENNADIEVMAIHKNGEETKLEDGWTIAAPKTLTADEKTVVDISYDDFSTELEVVCSTRTIERISAKYSGSTKSGVTIGKGNKDVTVTVEYKNGDKEEVSDWTVDEAVTLETGKTSKLKIYYKDEDCILKITCSDMTKKQYKEKCKSYSYNEVARDPDDYEDKYAKFSGKVLQVLESSDTSLVAIRLAVDGDYDHVIYIYYVMPSGSSRILEDDWISVYGTMGGLYSYEAVSGATITIPLMYAQYVD